MLAIIVGVTVWASFQLKTLHFQDTRISELVARLKLTPGPSGKQGDAGLTIIGATGVQGPKGDKGDTGEPGTDGKSGFGFIGQQGPQGEPGPQGEKGEKGQDGKTVLCRQTFTGTTECKYAGDTDWIPEEEF